MFIVEVHKLIDIDIGEENRDSGRFPSRQVLRWMRKAQMRCIQTAHQIGRKQ